MTDLINQQGLHVSTDGTAGPYVMVPFAQLEEVKVLFERHGIRYWVDENVISLNGGPEIAVVNLGRGSDPSAAQRILDGAP